MYISSLTLVSGLLLATGASGRPETINRRDAAILVDSDLHEHYNYLQSRNAEIDDEFGVWARDEILEDLMGRGIEDGADDLGIWPSDESMNGLELHQHRRNAAGNSQQKDSQKQGGALHDLFTSKEKKAERSKAQDTRALEWMKQDYGTMESGLQFNRNKDSMGRFERTFWHSWDRVQEMGCKRRPLPSDFQEICAQWDALKIKVAREYNSYLGL